MSFRTQIDFNLELARGNISGMSQINKFGRNVDVDTGTPEDIWDGNGLWIPPTITRTHDIVSTSANDAGSVVSTGTATGGSVTTLVDSGATFVSDGVVVGDTALDDTTNEHATIIGVTETTLTTHTTRHGTAFFSGDTYRIISPTSTGVSLIHVIGLGSDMVEQEEFIVMNGTTNVPTVNTYLRIYRMHVDGAPSRTVTNVGIITATAQTDGTITAQINAGNGQTLMAVFTIPAGKTGYMTNFYVSINKSGGTSALADITLNETAFASVDGSGSRLVHFTGISSAGSSYHQHLFLPYKKFLEQTDIWARCTSVSANNTDISAGFDIILVDN